MKNHIKTLLITLLLVVSTMSAQDYTSIIKNRLLSSRSSDGMTQQDLEGLTIYNQSTNRRSNIEHVYAIQKHNGIEVFNANVAVAFRGNKIVHMGDNLQLGIASRVRNTSPVLTPIEAATSAASLLGAGTANFTQLETLSSREVILNKGGVSLDKVPVKLVYQLTEDNEFRLAWDLSINMLNEPHWYSVRVDAMNGNILSKNDWGSNCSFGNHSSKREKVVVDKSRNSFGFNENTANVALSGGQYNVFPLPIESPNHGTNELITAFEDPEASPFGWHDIDGVEGAEFTITRGNNVWAQDDLDGDNQTFGTSPDGGSDLIFDFEYNFTEEPITMLEAVTTNLFYLNNVIHDVMYHYGFDEQSGNFQEFNYTGENFGNDAVRVDVQDSSTFNNASFFTPPEGGILTPSMSMNLWFAPLTDERLRLVGGNLDGKYIGTPAFFGAEIPETGETPVTASLVVIEDDNFGESTDINDGCDTIINGTELNGNIVLIRRGTCDFVIKALAAQNEGAIGVVLVNTSNATPPLAPGPGTSGMAEEVTIPVIMITMDDGEAMISAIQNGESISASIVEDDIRPMFDSGLDNGIVVHEYGHGISKRLTSSPFNSGCLNNLETGDEGWSDYFGLIFTMTENDEAENARGIATYVDGQEFDGEGIRPRPYSTNFSVNDLTYIDTNDENNISFPHGIGTVWATMLWDMTWYLIDEYGFDSDLYNGTGGNNISLQLVTDGLKLQPCSPGFIDSRDAIIAAIDINTMIPEEDKEEITCGIWSTFAARGLGVSADQGETSSRTDQEESFDAPIFENGVCAQVLSTNEFVTNNFSVYPNPSNGQISLRMKANLGEGQVEIIDLNGRIVFTQNSLLEGVLNVDADELSNGVYLLQVSNDMLSETTKLIIK